MGESWAYHIGHYLADQKYGSLSACAGEQGICYYNGYITGLSSHQVALEIFTPTFTTDPFHWIPKGVYYDLMDNGEPGSTLVNDQVLGYTNQQFFNAFNSSITTLGVYRQNLLQQNNNNQQVQVQNLFASYGY